MVHDGGMTVAQVAVPVDTNEITQVENLLETLPVGQERSVAVTMDAAHTQRDTAEYIAGKREDTHQARAKNGPRNMAILRNAAISTLRIGGHSNIAAATQWIARDRNRDLPLLATQSNGRYATRS